MSKQATPFTNRTPETQVQQKCADAELALGQAVTEYIFAAHEERVESGEASEDAKPLAVRDALSLCVGAALDNLLSVVALYGDGKTTPNEIASIFEDMTKQVTARVLKELPEHIAIIEDLHRKATSS